jgi:methylated-DNA-protein-cysteine methyltransferase related protein
MTDFARRVQRVVRRVPHGRVVSYGGVAALLGAPRAARAVGRAMATLPPGSDVPWWRVVGHTGRVSSRADRHASHVQRALLEAEGVRFDRSGRIDWQQFGWSPAKPNVEPGKPRPKQSVALLVRQPERDRYLLVQRPPDDPELPLAWGLPAASLLPGEAWTAAARRAARDKLGISIGTLTRLNEGRLDRADGTLHMRLYATAPATQARPAVPQHAPDVTQYIACRWGALSALRPAARKGSLCCQLALGTRA